MVLTFLTAVVGGMGLVGALSINVIERAKEIGALLASIQPTHRASKISVRQSLAYE